MADQDLVMHRFISDIPVEIRKAVRDIRYLQLPMLQAAIISGDSYVYRVTTIQLTETTKVIKRKI